MKGSFPYARLYQLHTLIFIFALQVHKLLSVWGRPKTVICNLNTDLLFKVQRIITVSDVNESLNQLNFFQVFLYCIMLLFFLY